MIPIFESTALFAPLSLGLAWLGAVAVAGTVAVVGLVAWAGRRPSRLRAVVTPLPRRLRAAA
jgi:hypothetical protein